MEYIKSIDKCLFKGRLRSFYRVLCSKLKSNPFYLKHIKYRGKAPVLTMNMSFPPHESSNKAVRLGPAGELLAVGGDLDPKRMINAYKNGICELSFNSEPLLWWTSDTRCVILPNSIYISKNMKKKILVGKFQLTVDKVFEDVINACANLREDDTWLTEERKQSCLELHKLGIAHSVEVWESGILTGGLFGVALGSYFLGESMFSLKDDASKLALIAISMRLDELGCTLHDCGIWPTKHLTSMGAECIDRDLFLGNLNISVNNNNIVDDWEKIFEHWDFQQAVKNKLNN